MSSACVAYLFFFFSSPPFLSAQSKRFTHFQDRTWNKIKLRGLVGAFPAPNPQAAQPRNQREQALTTASESLTLPATSTTKTTTTTTANPNKVSAEDSSKANKWHHQPASFVLQRQPNLVKPPPPPLPVPVPLKFCLSSRRGMYWLTGRTKEDHHFVDR